MRDVLPSSENRLLPKYLCCKCLFEKVGAHEQVESASPGRRAPVLRLHTLLNPAPTGRIGDVHELDTHASAINPAGLLRISIVDLKIRMGLGWEQTERIQFRLQISKLAKQAENPFALVVRRNPIGGSVGRHRFGEWCSRQNCELKSP